MIDIETEYQVKRKCYEALKPLPMEDINKILRELTDRLRIEHQRERLLERERRIQCTS